MMSGGTVLILILLSGCAVLALLAWRLPPCTRAYRLVVLTGPLLLALVATTADSPWLWQAPTGPTLVLLGVAAVAGGGPLSALVLALVDQEESRRESTEDGSLVAAASVLRGGAWIGSLERVAVFGTLVTGWPEGLALVLAVKGLGRYPELRSPATGAAERFIIGTFVSVLWASACALLALRVVA